MKCKITFCKNLFRQHRARYHQDNHYLEVLVELSCCCHFQALILLCQVVWIKILREGIFYPEKPVKDDVITGWVSLFYLVPARTSFLVFFNHIIKSLIIRVFSFQSRRRKFLLQTKIRIKKPICHVHEEKTKQSVFPDPDEKATKLHPWWRHLSQAFPNKKIFPVINIYNSMILICNVPLFNVRNIWNVLFPDLILKSSDVFNFKKEK